MADLNELTEKLALIKDQIKEKLITIETSKNAFEFKKSVFDSKTGQIGSLMREMGKIPNELKAEYGKKVNEIRTWATEEFESLEKSLKDKEMMLLYESEKIDVLKYDEDPHEFIKNALLPAEVKRVVILDKEKKEVLSSSDG